MTADLPAPGATATWRTTPLVVAACVEDDAHAARILGGLVATHADLAFITVVGAREPGDLGPLLDVLAPVMAERIFAVPGADRPGSAHALSMAALEQYGVGQDFVFEASSVAAAVGIAVGALAEGAGSPWDGRALLVVGDAEVLAEAHAALPPETPSSRG